MLHHWQHSHAWKGFSTWRAHVQQRRHKAELLQRAVGWLRNSMLLRAFLTWYEQALEQNLKRQSLLKVGFLCCFA